MPDLTGADDLLLGYDGYMYIGTNVILPGTTEFSDKANFPDDNEFDFIGDLSVGGNFETVDTTTRQTARTGFASELDTLQSGEATFTVQKRKLSKAIMLDLVQARKTKAKRAFLILSGKLGASPVEGTWGYTGNYTVNFNDGQPVKGIQTLDITIKLADNSHIVVIDVNGDIIDVPDTGDLPT